MIMMHTHTTGVRGSLLCFCIHKGTFEKQIQEINVNMKEILKEPTILDETVETQCNLCNIILCISPVNLNPTFSKFMLD